MRIPFPVRLKAAHRFLIVILLVCISHGVYVQRLGLAPADHEQRLVVQPAREVYYQLAEHRYGRVAKSLLGSNPLDSRYPTLVGTIVGIASFLTALNDQTARLVPLVFYLALLVYVFRLVSDMADAQTACRAALILATMPMVIVWSRMLFPDFFGMVFYVAALYHLMRSGSFGKIQHAVLFGLFCGLSILTHRVMFIPVGLLWYFGLTDRGAGSNNTQERRNRLLSFLTFLSVIAFFLKDYIGTRDEYLSPGNYFSFDSSGWGLVPVIFYNAIRPFGMDNLAALALILFLTIRMRRQTGESGSLKFFNTVAFVSVAVFLVFWLVQEYFTVKRWVNIRHFQILSPFVAIAAAVYLPALGARFSRVFIGFKWLLLGCLVAVPFTGGLLHGFVPGFLRGYAALTQQEDAVLGIGDFARRQELAYFSQEIRAADIAVMDGVSIYEASTRFYCLGDRLLNNGIGRRIEQADARPRFVYFMAYFKAMDDPAGYRRYEQDISAVYAEAVFRERILKVDQLNLVPLKGGERLCFDPSDFSYLDNFYAFIDTFEIEEVRVFEYGRADGRGYKVILKAKADGRAFENFAGRKYLIYFLRKV